MSLLTPINLLWLLPLLGSLLALYFLRPRRRSFEVPSLFLWNAVAQSSRSDKPFQKLKLSLLLIIQILALLLLVAVLAHPFTRPRPVAKAVYVIVIDQAVTMEATDVSPDRSALAREAAEQYVRDNVHGPEEALVIGAGENPVLLCGATQDRSKLIAAIDLAHPFDTAADLPAAMTFAHAAEPKAAAIVLFGDGAWNSGDDGELLSNASAPIRLATFGTINPSNAGIVKLSARVDQLHPAAAPQILTVVDQHNSSACRLDITIDGKPAASAMLHSHSGTTTKVFTIAALRQGGLVSAKLSGLNRDDLKSDNVSSLVVGADTAKKVLLVTSGDSYLERALALLPNIDLYEARPSEYQNSPGQFDLIVFDGWLPSSLPLGASLVFNAVNSDMPVEQTGDPLTSPEIVDWNETDPLLSYVDLSTVHLRTARLVRPASWGTVVAELSQSPVIVKGNQAGKSVVWVGFTPSDSDFPLQPAFPIFLSNAVHYLTTVQTSIAQEQIAGTPIVLRPVNGTWSVTDPSGRTTDVPCTLAAGCQFDQTQLAGLYQARIGDVTQTFATNVASSDLTDIAVKPHPMLGTVAGSPINRTLTRIDLSPWLAGLALVVILIEWLIYNRASRYTNPI